MVTWNDFQTITQTLSSDSTPDTLTFLKLMGNVAYKLILADLGRPVTEKTQTASTVASQQYYQLPPDYLYLKAIKITVGSNVYPVAEEESQEIWDYLNLQTTPTSDIPERFFIRQGFGVSGAEVGIYPIPSSASNTITMVYEATDKDLSNDKYTTGTITITNGSATITGSGTTFTAAMVGRYLKVTSSSTDGLWYRITSYTSATVITLENVYEGSSGGTLTYEISEIFALPEEMQILPCYYALAHYFGIKKDASQESKYWTLYTSGVEMGKRRWGTKTRSIITRGAGMRSRFSVWGPPFFPTSAS